MGMKRPLLREMLLELCVTKWTRIQFSGPVKCVNFGIVVFVPLMLST